MMSSLSAIKMIESKDKKFLFEKNIIYLAYMGRINKPLPHNIKMSFSPKSSIGRIDVHVRVIADNNDIIDYIQPIGQESCGLLLHHIHSLLC